MAKINSIINPILKGKTKLKMAANDNLEKELMRRNGKMIQLNSRFPKLIIEQLFAYAKETNEPYALVIRHAVFDFLKEKGKI